MTDLSASDLVENGASLPLTKSVIRSSRLGNERQIWLQPTPLTQAAKAICILLDGEYYVERMEVPKTIDELQRSSSLPSFAVAYISHVDGQTRWKESQCHEDFAGFVAEELIPWVKRQVTHASKDLPVILGGLSLTGLAAAHAVLRFPDRYAGVLCQSASFWWSDQWLVNEYQSRDAVSVRFRISCGALETTDYVEHGPDLIQRTSQIASNRSMRDVLQIKRCDVSYEEFDGGHDLASWKADLPRSLLDLLKGTLVSGTGY